MAAKRELQLTFNGQCRAAVVARGRMLGIRSTWTPMLSLMNLL
jgi:hypothetical protein